MDYEKLLFDRAASTLKTHGIISIIFGGLGVLAGVVFTSLMAFGTAIDESLNIEDGSTLGVYFMGLLIFIFWTLPHIYFIVAGSFLLKDPSPQLAKTLVIINLVVGVFWNLVLLIFAIINLTEISDYERGYHHHRKHPHKG